MEKDFYYMKEAIKEAMKAEQKDEVPIGAVIVKDGKIIARAHNTRETKQISTHHAEINCIEKACKKIGFWRLDDCELYVTLEPCPMCASAIKQARIKNVYSALSNKNKENFEIISQIFKKDATNPEINFENNLSTVKSETLLQKFFDIKRKK